MDSTTLAPVPKDMLLSMGACQWKIICCILTEGAALKNVHDSACNSSSLNRPLLSQNVYNDNVLNLDICGLISVNK